MRVEFSKYHGCGNDFILIDARANEPKLTAEQISTLCHRRFGIGADGLILLTADPAFDFGMVYFNSDGQEGSMCGNGGRCITAFANRCGIVKASYHFIAADGPHDSFLIEDGAVRLKMKDVAAIERADGRIFADTGSPHVVEPVKGLDSIDVLTIGRSIRNSTFFYRNGTNVNFVEVVDAGLRVRTYERGVEDETYACGTGVTASVLAAAALGWIPATSTGCPVETKGGRLAVSFDRDGSSFRNVWLEGPAVHVFDGVLEL